MQVELIKIDELKPFEKNPKTHSEEQIKRIIRSIQEFGWANPILALKENKMVIAGHARLKAAKQMNLAEVPVVFLDMSYEKAIAYVVADNRLAEIAEWDNQMLLPLLEEIKLSGIDVELTGFTAQDISLMNTTEVQEDDFDAEKAAEAIKEPITKLGDIWILGRHRLMCGDSTKKEDVEKLMGGGLADMVFTDPPYGVDYVGKTKDKLKIDNDAKDEYAFLEWLKAVHIRMREVTKSGASAYVCHADLKGKIFREAFESFGEVRQCIIWVKNHFVMGRQDYQWQHEPILYGWADGASHTFYAGRNEVTTWFIDRPGASKEHPTMKPLGLSARALMNSSKGDDIILDQFAGSGSTLLSCEQMGRICYTMELSPKYCDVVVQRWEKYTGQNAHKQEVAL